MKSENSNNMEIPYVHEKAVHNMDSPSQIAEVLIDIFQPSSIVDVGCGIGTFVHAFRDAGITDVKGVDGKWVNKDLLKEHMPLVDFIEADLQKPLKTDRKFDLLISLEVAEHLDAAYADVFVSNLTTLSDTIVFSAAIPGQPGQNHINGQWIEYWQRKFESNGYRVYDVMRPLFWDNPKIFYWYKQNMFLVLKEGIDVNYSRFEKYKTGKILHSVHPELLQKYVDRLNNIQDVNSGVSYYFNLFLKSLKKKFLS